MSSSVELLAQRIATSRRTVVLTGAGVSTESGIPDFRSDSGVWAHADPMEVGSIEGFRENPKRFYDFWSRFFSGIRTQDGKPREVKPSAMHRLLADLERRDMVHAVITQNVDSLHQEAGSQRLIEAHGNWERTRCVTCGTRSTWSIVMAETPRGHVPSCDACGGMVRPDVVLFGELLGPAFEVAKEEVAKADLFIAMGTSLEVAPVSNLPLMASERGASVAIVNREATAHDREADILVRGELGQIAAELARLLG